ncbi:MAG: hypothetical protein ACK40G_09115 [Cytophagaceae bacterium]
MKSAITVLFLSLTLFLSCNKTKTEPAPATGYKILFQFKFDSTLARLDNFGNPAEIPAGNAAVSPKFNSMSAHYIEFAPNKFTQVGNGQVLYRAPETSAGGSLAIDFNKSVIAKESEVFFSVPVSSVAPGTYEYLRVSLAYQNFEIPFKYQYLGNEYKAVGTLASFVGFNTYISKYKIKDLEETVNGNKKQGYWGFETLGQIYTGQAPEGSTTVPNPIHFESPIPPGSCLVTGKFESPLIIPASPTQDITIVVAVSTNKSFEWQDGNADGWFQPDLDEKVVDMGIRGIYPIIE